MLSFPVHSHMRASRRSGFSLIELLLVLVLLSAVMGTLMSVIVRQQRFYRGASDIMNTRTQVRHATHTLPIELRGISSVGGGGFGSDIISMSPSSIEFLANVGSSIACELVGGTTIVLPPRTLASGATLTSFLARPMPGDIAKVYDDGTNTNANLDDSWSHQTVTTLEPQSIASATQCPTSTGFTSTADDARPRWILEVSPGVPASTLRGAAIRFLRRVRYSLYQSPADGKWYLGYQSCPGGSCTTVEPVSGPYRALDTGTPGNSGLAFRYFDSSGAETTTRTAVARIELVARAETEDVVDIAGLARDRARDSLAVTIAVRNRR